MEFGEGAALKPREHITLLHLSDVQFGRHHRFGRLASPAGDDDFDSLLTRLGDDLGGLAKEHGLRPDILVVSGDLAEEGKRSEFEDAGRLLVGLVELLGLERDRVVIVPGNHDVNWNACQAHFFQCAAEERQPERPYWPKWTHYDRLFHDFFRDVTAVSFTEEEPWTLFPMPELRVVVAGLNSTMAESHREDDHYGQIGEAQLRWFAEKLAPYRERGWLRIGVVHHNVVRGCADDDENLRDADDLERLLGPYLNLVLHGHTHSGKLHVLNGELPVLATGSGALAQPARPEDVPNQYQIVRLWRDRFCHWTRAYAPDRKEWIGDTRASKKGDGWWCERRFSFQAVETTFPDRRAKESSKPVAVGDGVRRGASRHAEKSGLVEHRDDFLARVERVCRLRETEAEVDRIASSSITSEYLRVTTRKGDITHQYAVGAIRSAVTAEAFTAFLAVHRRYERTDSGAISTLVYGGESPAAAIAAEAARSRVRLRSFVEYQGLLDFRTYLARQTRRLTDDPRYPPPLYVEQKLDVTEKGEERREQALAALERWLADSYGRFVLVLGDFGTGKTFLLHELARRMGEAGGPLVPVLIEMRDLEKGRGDHLGGALPADSRALAGSRVRAPAAARGAAGVGSERPLGRGDAGGLAPLAAHRADRHRGRPDGGGLRRSEVLAARELSPLMADFLAGLAGRERAAEWARAPMTKQYTCGT